MIGKTILHYKILEKLGEGGMGVVYLARDTRLERKAAIKFLPHHISADEVEKERFKVEAKTAAALNHPNIATIYAIEETCDQVFIAMEYIRGVELSEKIKSGIIPVDEAIKIATQIADGLNAAHREGIIHRDIKSSNIMITDSGIVKIMDFGLAKVRGDSNQTQTGFAPGTIAYMSPEQSRGGEVDQTSDIWSFGVVLYEMLSGHLPFGGDYDQAIIYSIQNKEPQSIARYNNNVSTEFERIVFKALARDKEERYQHIDEMLVDMSKEQQNYGDVHSGYSKASMISRERTELKVKKGKRFLKFGIPVMIFVLITLAFYTFDLFTPGTSQDLNLPASKKSLAVMYFENMSDPEDKEHEGDMITNLLITDLSQIKEIEVISRDQLYRILEDLGLSDNKTITYKTAIKIAQNAGVSTILVGSILQDDPSLAVTTQLIDVKSGNILGSQRLAGFGSKQIFSLVDSLALLIRNDMQITLDNTSGARSVAEVTTDSPEAYRAYVEGLNLADKLYFKEAASAFKKAIEFDSSFAMAYYNLSALEDPGKRRESLQKAVELADNTTERERLLIFAWNYLMQNKSKEASEIYRKVIEKYPHEIEAYNNLALISDPDTTLLLNGVHANPSAKILWDQLALTYALNNQKKEALNAVNEYIRLSPAEPNPYDSKGEIFAIFMDYDSSAIYYKKAMEFRQDSWRAAMKLSCYDVLQGRYEEAQKYIDRYGEQSIRYPSINVHRGLLNSEIKRLENVLKTNIRTWDRTCIRAILIHLYYETGRFKKMLFFVKRCVGDWKDLFPNDHYGRTFLVWALAINNNSMEAEKIIEGMQENKDESFPWVQVHALFASSMLSFEKGDYNLALDKFNKTFSKLKPNHEPNIFQAICLLKTGQIQKAVKQFNLIKNWPMFDLSYQMIWVPGGKFYGYINNVKAHYWLGIAYEKLGKKDKAIDEYKTFLDIWKDADFNSPEINDAKVRLEKLKT